MNTRIFLPDPKDPHDWKQIFRCMKATLDPHETCKKSYPDTLGISLVFHILTAKTVDTLSSWRFYEPGVLPCLSQNIRRSKCMGPNLSTLMNLAHQKHTLEHRVELLEEFFSSAFISKVKRSQKCLTIWCFTSGTAPEKLLALSLEKMKKITVFPIKNGWQLGYQCHDPGPVRWAQPQLPGPGSSGGGKPIKAEPWHKREDWKRSYNMLNKSFSKYVLYK